MKFTLLTQAALAISSVTGAVANPTPDISTVRYAGDWVEAGLDRYRMWLITAPRNDRHLQLYCEAGHSAMYLTNVQCFWGDDGKYYIDASVARGPAGHTAIQRSHSAMCDDFQSLTKCGTNREF
ncbi:hypothetical protein FAVG1_08792 [Fusarium avenaceum]|nr:hypothetical protein FAVG1_08792 [Fusarium avenaceum]